LTPKRNAYIVTQLRQSLTRAKLVCIGRALVYELKVAEMTGGDRAPSQVSSSFASESIVGWRHLALLPGAYSYSSSFTQQTPEDIQRQLKEALDLYDKDATLSHAAFSTLDEILPNDRVKAHVGFALVALAVTKVDPEERRTDSGSGAQVSDRCPGFGV